MNIFFTPPRLLLLLLTLTIITLSWPLDARQMRTFRPIASPTQSSDPQTRLQPPSRSLLESAVSQVSKAWSSGQVEEILAPDFQRKERFKDAMALDVPQDTQMRVEGTRGLSTLEQRIITNADGSRQKVSLVSATIQTRLELEDPTSGRVSVPGTNEMIFEVIQPLD